MIVFNDKGFAKPQMFLNLFISNAGLLVIAMGETIVMITAGIDISVGSVTALVCMVAANQMENHGASAYTALLMALVIGLLFGLVQGFLVSYLEIQPFIVTLAGMFFARGMTAIISKDMISITNETFMAWAKAKIYLPFGGYLNKKGILIQPYIYPTVVIALLLVVLAFIMLKYTKFGRSLYAVGGNEQSAMMMGLNVRKVKLKAYVLDGFLCGVGGVLFCLNTLGGFVEQAKGFEMDAIASCYIGGAATSGGIGTIIGAVVGAFIMGILNNGMSLYGWSTDIQKIVKGAVLLGAVTVDLLSKRKKG